MKGVIVLVLLLLIPLANSISIKELIARYSFSSITSQMNVTNHADFMIDKNSNGINDTLVFELATSNSNGNYIFIINLFDKDGILTNEVNKTLNAGINKLNITFNSIFLTQPQFNYSIKIYNSTYSLKYRKDNILTQNYLNYEEGFRILDAKDSEENKALKINVTLNSSVNGTFETALFLAYNNSMIFSKENKSITDSAQYLMFNFDSEAIKRTHYTGSFNITSLKLNKKIIKTNFTTAFYDFRDFAVKSYISGFADNGIDTGADNKYDILQINTNAQIINDGNYNAILALYDLFGNLIEIKNASSFLSSGENVILFNINGSKIYDKKLNGPFVVKYSELYENGTLIDRVNDAYSTSNYNFNGFNGPTLPDLKAEISASGEYHYGINSLTINFSFKNIGNKHAFNVFTEIFDNSTFFKSDKSNILNANSQIAYQINFANISDFEISAIADLQDFVEELNESNNAERVIIKLNKKPVLAPISDITTNEKDKIILNLSAFDPNDDALYFSINLTRFLGNSNIFEWDTTTADSGSYTLKATVSDGFLNDSVIFKIAILDVPDAPENDLDKDGIDDSIDKIIGDKNFVNTSTINLAIFVGNSSNLSLMFNKSLIVKFFDNDLKILEFPFDFSSYRLNLTEITIDKQFPGQKGSLLVKGLKLPNATKKMMYVDNINKSLKLLCIKDTQIANINNISKNCKSANEVKINCNGKFSKSYRCTYNATSNKYRVERLRNSGIIQI